MNNFKTPGVYVQEITKFPPSIAAVETAIPAFIGYTEIAKLKVDNDLINTPHRIKSSFDYLRFFGEGQIEGGITFTVDTTQTPVQILTSIANPSKYQLYHAIQAFFNNGGGPCYIISVGNYTDDAGVVDKSKLEIGLEEAGKIDEITLNVFPDGQGLTTAAAYYDLQKQSIDQCVDLQDRFAVMDVWAHNDIAIDDIQVLRNTLSGPVDILKYGAAYYPQLEMLLSYRFDKATVNGTLDGSAKTLAELETERNDIYNQVKNKIENELPVIMQPSGAIVGIYANVDNARGVWKAPANINIDGAIRPLVKITDNDQQDINVDTTGGKSVNAIRTFIGRGAAMVWGARTLAGNDNEWRYVSVRRFFNMVEESTKKATVQFVFEPNDINTWTRVKSMIENFLIQQWKAGALMGTTPEQAFYVKIGLNETMTEVDIWEGRMIVEIGMAVVRPAEFIILKFSHKMLEEN